MIDNTSDIWREVLSVDWPVRSERLRAALEGGPVEAEPAASPAQILDRSLALLRRALPVDTRVVVVLSGEGGGAWTLDHTNVGPRVVRGEAPWFDSHLRCPVDRFLELLREDLDPAHILSAVDAELQGDVGLLLRLRAAWIADAT